MMNTLKLLVLGVMVFAFTSCSTVRVAADYDRQADFSSYKTFAFFKPGIDKAENVWVGLDAARYEILMILDGDLAVAPEELNYFYDAIRQGKGEFINGSRLVYPMENNAMRFANTIGNKFFSLFFSYIIS